LQIAFLMCLALPALAAANGPAWVAELSDTTPSRADALEVTIPVGSHVAVGVYNTDAVTPQPPAGVAATVRVLWLEHRTVFRGTPNEREAAIPYYLPLPRDCAPTGSWVVELQPETAGHYAVPIACNTNTVTVDLTVIDLPPSEIGYGLYTDSARYPDPLREPEYDADMAAHGCNTLTPYARELPAEFGVDNTSSAVLLAWHIDTAIDAGLVDLRFPLLCLSIGPDQLGLARQYARHEWPELVGYNNDEPAPSARQAVEECSAQWHAAGFRTGTAITLESALAAGGSLDIWVLLMETVSREAIAVCVDQGKEQWLYNCVLRGSNAALERYYAGVYAWAVKPRVCLSWAYTHDPESRIRRDGTWNLTRYYGKAAAERDGAPLPTVALEGTQEGIIDSRLLQELERRNTPEGNAYLARLREQVPLDFWPDGKGRGYDSEREGYYVWDIPDTAVPPVDLPAMRRDVLRLLRGATN
jgi:hypothetical protein